MPAIFSIGTIEAMERTIHSLDGLRAEAPHFVGSLAPRADRATLIALSGELGAGKTAFSKAIAEALGVEEHITSPTFVLMKLYPLRASLFSQLVHIDAYRMKTGKELEALDFDSLMEDPTNLILLEWPEQVADTLPEPDKTITLTVAPDNTRLLTYGS